MWLIKLYVMKLKNVFTEKALTRKKFQVIVSVTSGQG